MSINKNLNTVLNLLTKHYPGSRIELNYTNNWELLVAVILSAQCTDVMVNKVTDGLFRKYKTIKDYADTDITRLENDVKKTGFFRQKAKRIKESAEIILKKFNGEIPKLMNDLLTLPGVARKTANVVLGNAFNISEGIAVDTHVRRISQRLRLVDTDKIGGKTAVSFKRNNKILLDYIQDADPEKIETELMKTIPKEKWFSLTYQIIDHGRAICKAQNPRCKECFLNSLCPAGRI